MNTSRSMPLRVTNRIRQCRKNASLHRPVICGVLAWALWLATLAFAPDAQSASEASITGIDSAKGVVMARETPAGRTFQFAVADPKVRGTLKVGQKVQADFQAKIAVLPGVPGRFPITNVSAPSAAPKVAVAAGSVMKPPPPKGENEDDEPDGRRPARMALKMPSLSPGARSQHLKDHPRGEEIMKDLLQALKDKEIDVALLGGEKYMLNNCLGIKASAGTFRFKLASPNFRWEETGVRLTFRIDRISMNALSVRYRPNPTNAAYPCHFSKKHTIGGSASDVSLEYRFDPILDLQQCKLGSLGSIHRRVGIGGLNLKPLQNDLDRAAKNMIEDSINNVMEFNVTDRIITIMNAILGTKCHA
jgi:hypothetical protein